MFSEDAVIDVELNQTSKLLLLLIILNYSLRVL